MEISGQRSFLENLVNIMAIATLIPCVNTLRPRQNGRYFAGDIFKCISLNENAWILLKISLKILPKAWMNNIPALVQIMAWRQPGDSHYLNQWWLVYWCIYASLSLFCVEKFRKLQTYLYVFWKHFLCFRVDIYQGIWNYQWNSTPLH